MRILAADIGGTNARFAEVAIEGRGRISMSEPLVFPTWSEEVNSFDDMLACYARSRTGEGQAIENYDAIAIAIAGAVSGKRATLPNIPWDIDLTVSSPLQSVFLLNDFYAQAHCYLDETAFEQMKLIRPGPGNGPGAIAVVGAGTGLGHAALIRVGARRMVIGSESGHGTFAFHGDAERKIEASLLARSGRAWLASDDVVSGGGAAMIHEALTGRTASPAEALAPGDPETATCRYFARFYARACRDYCLAVHPVEALVISGGVAAGNPHIIESASFMQEFNDARSYRHLMERVPIYLNQDQALGIKGAAIHAWESLAT